MNDRLTESTPVSDSPIPEARGPHLPDILTRQSPWTVAFGAVALVQVWLGVRQWAGDFPIPQSDNIPLLAHAVIPSAVVPLMGAALFIRHPGARRTMPALVFGLVALTIVQILGAIDAPIRAVLGSLGGPDDGSLAPAGVAYAVFRALLQLFAILYIAVGLAEARRAAPTGAQRPLAIWLGTLAVVGTVVSIASVAQFGLDVTGTGGALVVAIDIALALFTSLVWAYLVSVTVGGALAGDEPRSAWRMAGIGTAIVFAFRLLAGIVLGVGEPWASIVETGSYVALAGWVLLLVAFCLGLPAGAADEAAAGATPAEPTADPPAATPPGSAAG